MADIIIFMPAKTPETLISALREIANTNDIKLVVIADTPEQHDPYQPTTMDFVIPEPHFEQFEPLPKQIQKQKAFPHITKSLETFKTTHTARQKIFHRAKHK